jgi:hypothetical protein
MRLTITPLPTSPGIHSLSSYDDSTDSLARPVDP